jgi:hypothetical protein
MLSKIAKVSLVSTAFAPVLLTLGYRYYKGGNVGLFIGAILTAVLLCGLCLLLLHAARTQLQTTSITVTSVKTADTEIVGFVIAYLLPLVTVDGQGVDMDVLAFVLVLLLLVVWATHAYHVNPLLALFGYHFYEITDGGDVTHILITRRTLRDSKHITKTVQLTEYMLLDVSDQP